MEGDNYWRRAAAKRVGRRSVIGGAGAVGAGLAGLALVGCGDDDDQPKATAASSPAAPASASAAASASASPAAAQPKKGGTFYISMGGEPPHLDPHTANTAYSYGFAYGGVYSGLLKPQSLGAKGAIIPVGDLAEKWEQVDKTNVVFTLRQNAKWHSVAPVNGRAVTADDVVYAFKRQIDLKIAASALAGIKSVTAPDAKTVKIELNVPDADFITSQTAPNIKVVAREAVESKGGKLDEGPVVGTGPWVFKEWRKGVGMSLTRNPDYFIAGLPYANAVEGVVQKDQALIESSFLAGKLSYVQNAGGGIGLPNKTVKSLDTKKFGVYRQAPNGNLWAMMDNAKPELKDPRIRKALSMAIDRDLIIENALDGFGTYDSFLMTLPSPDWRLSQEELKKLLGQNLKDAKAMLEAAGGLQKQQVAFYEAAVPAAAAQLAQANWKAIGFDATLQTVDSVTLTGKIQTANSDFFMCVTPLAHAATLTGDLELWYKTGGSRNGQHIADPELDKQIDAQKGEFDAAKRKDLILQMQRYILDKGFMAPISAGIAVIAYPLTTHNVEPPAATGAHHWIAEAWLDG